jgi:hypothetical protein
VKSRNFGSSPFLGLNRFKFRFDDPIDSSRFLSQMPQAAH